MTGCVYLQAPLLAYNHFVESIFVLNNWQSKAHTLTKGSVFAESDEMTSGAFDSGLADSTAASRERRDLIYRCRVIIS